MSWGILWICLCKAQVFLESLRKLKCIGGSLLFIIANYASCDFIILICIKQVGNGLSISCIIHNNRIFNLYFSLIISYNYSSLIRIIWYDYAFLHFHFCIWPNVSYSSINSFIPFKIWSGYFNLWIIRWGHNDWTRPYWFVLFKCWIDY